jgi:thiaminase
MKNNIIYKDFVNIEIVKLFKQAGANDKIIALWRSQSKNIEKILSSKMVQGMKKNTLTRQQFDEVYMKPDVIYIYNLGVALKKRALKEDKINDRNNIMMLAEMYLGYQTKYHRFKKYGLNIKDRLDDKICMKHIELLAEKTTIEEYYISILTDMMPYVCFANYLYNIIDTDDNIWMAYAKKYGTLESEYVAEKLSKSFAIVNNILDVEAISLERAEKLFKEGMYFERYFIDKAMTGELVSKIQKYQKKV